MEKLIYWLKKLGILRSASYSVKGDASKLNEMHATDGGMIQSQKEIDKEHEEKTGKKLSKKPEKKKTRILFWIFSILAFFFILGFWGLGFSFGSFVVVILWITFLIFLWKGEKSWAASFVKVLIFGLVLSVISLFFFGSTEEEGQNNSQTSGETQEEAQEQKCDDSNSEYANFNKVEKVIVSINPCEVPWILAQPVENYELKTKKGTVLKATVFNNYINNVEAGESYTIRVLDREEDVTGQKDLKKGISIVRWVKDKAALPQAKKEVKEAVEKLDF